MRIWTIAASLLFTASLAATEPIAATSMDDLVRLDECQLLTLYKSGKPGPIPCGFAPGRVISKPGSHSTVRKSNALKHVWQGKHFDGDVMTNRIFGMKFIKGQVTAETSWLDGQPSNGIDYSHTSLLFKGCRDEFREVAPGLYLGVMWKRDDCNPKLLTWFTFDTQPCCAH